MRTLGIVMNPIEDIKPYKDTTLALMLAAQRRDWKLRYLEPVDLWLRDGVAMGYTRGVRVYDDSKRWFEFEDMRTPLPLGQLSAILMRVDPPFNLEYVAATYILERAEAQGAIVVNKPQALRDCNEKAFTAWFADLAPPTIFSRDSDTLRAFHAEFGDVIYKPIAGMGGQGVFRVGGDGLNLGSIIEQLSQNGNRTIVAQQYLPAITDGDKRVLIIDGQAVPSCLARTPTAGEIRANLAAGGRGEVRPLGAAEKKIASIVGPELKRRGLLFVGLDVIGDWLTEINVTSPTCAREIDAASGTDIGGMLIEAIERRLSGP